MDNLFNYVLVIFNICIILWVPRCAYRNIDVGSNRPVTALALRFQPCRLGRLYADMPITYQTLRIE